MTTTDGKPVSVAMLVCSAPPGSVFTVPLDALEADAFEVGTFPVPGDPSPGKTVPS